MRLRHADYKAKRKAQLNALPRCQVAGCKRRGNWRSMGALLCGLHMERAKASFHRQTAGLGILGALIGYDATDVLTWASGKD